MRVRKLSVVMQKKKKRRSFKVKVVKKKEIRIRVK